eukprot:8336-Heterococcus_DN1.PRE.1
MAAMANQVNLCTDAFTASFVCFQREQMGRCNCEAVNAGTPLAQNAEDHYFTWVEQMDYLNHNAPLIVGNQCPVCLDEVAQGLICYPGDIVDTCVMASGE